MGRKNRCTSPLFCFVIEPTIIMAVYKDIKNKFTFLLFSKLLLS